jgi:hypothetical protein
VAKAQSPLLGFNNNVRHRGRVFHIQTEDSGIKHPHVITHLFADGGRILNSTKTSYAEHAGSENLTETVRAMMKDQHRAMFIALREGRFDHLLEDSRAEQPKAADRATPEPAGFSTTSRAPDWAREDSARLAAAAAPSRSSASQAPGRASREGLKPTELERSPLFRPPSEAAVAGARSAGRYSASRPAAVFAAVPPSQTKSVFGEDVISSKSLDEVILSFLSEEFGAGSENADDAKSKK